MSNPTDVAHVGTRFAAYVRWGGGTPREVTAYRVQSITPSGSYGTEVYNELGNVDPVGSATEPPEFRIVLEENQHGVDLDQVLAGVLASATTWNAGSMIQPGLIKISISERNVAGTVFGEFTYDGCTLTEVSYEYRVGQPIVSRYTFLGRLASRIVTPGILPHPTWPGTLTTQPGAIKYKDARLYLEGFSVTPATDLFVYRIQSMTLRIQYRATAVLELGNRQRAGYVVDPPIGNLLFDLAYADDQPDRLLWTTSINAIDYLNPVTVNNIGIRIFDPAGVEGTTVLRAFKIETAIINNATPAPAQVRGIATKRYDMMIPKAVTSGSGGVVFFKGDLS